MKTAINEINFSNLSDSSHQIPLFPEELPIQESTHQVPIGRGSIFEPLADTEPTEYQRAIYLVISYKSNWDTGISHALSYQTLADLTGTKHRQQVIFAVNELIRKGWLEVAGTRKSDGANFYKVIHHNVDPEEIPKDEDGRPLKCAVQCGKGSALQHLFDGLISWRVMVHAFVHKVYSDWTSGELCMPVRESLEKLRFGAKTIAKNIKTMVATGLTKVTSFKNKASEFLVLPSPYLERRPRAELNIRTPLKLIDGCYYSFNQLWRFNRETFEVQGRSHELEKQWHPRSMGELLSINAKIHKDFKELMDKIKEMRDSFFSTD